MGVMGAYAGIFPALTMLPLLLALDWATRRRREAATQSKATKDNQISAIETMEQGVAPFRQLLSVLVRKLKSSGRYASPPAQIIANPERKNTQKRALAVVSVIASPNEVTPP